MVENRKSNNGLRVRRVVDAPLHEVSGICLRRGRNGRMSRIAVGDRMSKIAWFSLPRSDDGRIDWHTGYIAKLSDPMLPRDDPEIKAVCADGLGRVLLLQKTPPRVELIDPKALNVVASIGGGGSQRNCASVVRPEGVANGATARRAFARRQLRRGPACGVHCIAPAPTLEPIHPANGRHQR